MFQVDWTIVPGSNGCMKKWKEELRRRATRNDLIHEMLSRGGTAWYTSSGNSMWPIVRSGDAITLHPTQAVTAGSIHGITKGESNIFVGDVVYASVQPGNEYYCHLVVKKEQRVYLGPHNDWPQTIYWIGNIKGYMNGWCNFEHIHGVCVNVQQPGSVPGSFKERPDPCSIYATVLVLLKAGKNKDAAWEARATEGVSRGSLAD